MDTITKLNIIYMPGNGNDGIGLGTGNRSTTDNNLVVGYSPSDFFYVNVAEQYNVTVDQATCANLDPYNETHWEKRCNNDTIFDNSANCIQKELCKNKDAADQLLKTQSITTGTDAKYQDVKIQHNNELMFTCNLGIGIIFVAALIYQNITR